MIATRPTTAPTHAPSADGLWPRIPSKKIHASAADADAVFVVANAIAACPDADSAEPALKPNQPNHSMPVPRMTNGMFAGRVRFAAHMGLAAAEDDRAGQRREAGRHVDDRAAREVEHAQLVQEALRMPRPVRERRVDEDAEQAHEQEVARKPHAFGERPRDQRRRDDRELQLEQREQDQRDRRREIRVRRRPDARNMKNVAGCRSARGNSRQTPG